MLTDEQVRFYKNNGYISVSGVLTDAEIADLQAGTNGFLERSRTVTESDDEFDLEPGHTAEAPRLRQFRRDRVMGRGDTSQGGGHWGRRRWHALSGTRR